MDEKGKVVAVDKQELLMQIDVAEWYDLRAHLERGALIYVDDTLDLAVTGMSIAEDDTEAVGAWLNAGKVGKPSDAQVNSWNSQRGKKFSMLIVSPFVLIQERLPIMQ